SSDLRAARSGARGINEAARASYTALMELRSTALAVLLVLCSCRREAPPVEPEPAPGTDAPANVQEPPPPHPEELAERRQDPYFCEDSAECALSCPQVAGCCGEPCGCRHAIHVQHRAAYEENYARTCGRPPCPEVACAYE